jgi:putative hydrolase of the HAD superfamily
MRKASYMNSVTSLQSVQVITFDLDDTLCPERQYVQSGFKAVSTFLREQALVKQDVFPAMWSKFIAGEHSEIFNRVLAEYEINPTKDLIEKLVTVYRTHHPEITLYSDAHAVLDYFHGRKPLALISDGYEQTQTAKLAALGIKHYFDTIVLTDQLGRDCWKPSPVGFKTVMQALGGKPAEYVYIGDNPKKDFAAPRQLGWKSICVRRTEGVYAESIAPNELFEADFLVNDLYEAAKLLDPAFAAPQ